MIVGILIIAVLTVILIVVAARKHLGLDALSIWAQVLQAIATSIGIGVAGYLYFAERHAKPHADLSQTVQAVALPDDVAMIEASVVVKNLGTQLLTVDRIRSSLQLVDLNAFKLPDLPSAQGAAYWGAKGTVGGEPAPAFYEAELHWPQMRYYDGRVHHEIEPGESDLITVTFLIQCPGVRYVRVATDVQKHDTKAFGGLMMGLVWKGRTVVDLDPVCKKGA